MTATDLTFDGTTLSSAVPDALVLQVVRSLLGARRDTYQDVPGRAGTWLFPDQPSDGQISVPINILSADTADRRAAVAAIASWADSTGWAKLIVSDEPDRYWDAKLADTGGADEWGLAADLTLLFRTGPYAWATAKSSESWTATDGDAHAFTIPDDVDADPVVQITAGASSIDGFTLTCNGVALTYGATLAAGASRTVSSIAYVVTTGTNPDTDLTGFYDPAHLSMATVDGDFPTLKAGANSITLDGGGADIVVAWRRRFRG